MDLTTPDKNYHLTILKDYIFPYTNKNIGKCFVYFCLENCFDGMSVGLKSLNSNKLYYTYYNHENKYPKSLSIRSFFYPTNKFILF